MSDAERLEGEAAAAGLSARERVVAREAAAGGTLEEVAERLFVSRNTVKTQLAAVYRKLGIDSREALARWYAQRVGP